MVATTKMTSKGQVTVPKEVRERLGLRVGDELEFVEEHGEFRVRKRVGSATLQRYRGYLKDLIGQDPDRLVQEMRDP
jgi:AbrB family looped-hinge helix DNA binding protein